MVPTLGLVSQLSAARTGHRLERLVDGVQSTVSFTLRTTVQSTHCAGDGSESFLNSLFITVPATLLNMLVAAFAAYAFAWMKFRGRDALFLVVIGLIVVPLQLTLIPVLRMYASVGLTGTFQGIWLAHAAYGLPFAVLLLRNFFVALPKDLLESAFLEGASHFTAFWADRAAALGAGVGRLGIFQFLWVWNDLLIALVYLGWARRTSRR